MEWNQYQQAIAALMSSYGATAANINLNNNLAGHLNNLTANTLAGLQQPQTGALGASVSAAAASGGPRCAGGTAGGGQQTPPGGKAQPANALSSCRFNPMRFQQQQQQQQQVQQQKQTSKTKQQAQQQQAGSANNAFVDLSLKKVARRAAGQQARSHTSQVNQQQQQAAATASNHTNANLLAKLTSTLLANLTAGQQQQNQRQPSQEPSQPSPLGSTLHQLADYHTSNQPQAAPYNYNYKALEQLIRYYSSQQQQQQQQPFNLNLSLANLKPQNSGHHANNTINNDHHLQQNQEMPTFDPASLRLLESLFTMNEEPGDEAIEMIAQKVNSTSLEVAKWFELKRESNESSSNASLIANVQSTNLNSSSPTTNLSTGLGGSQACDDAADDDDDRNEKSPSSGLSFQHTRSPTISNLNNNSNNQILNYSNFQQSILETVLGSAQNNNSNNNNNNNNNNNSYNNNTNQRQLKSLKDATRSMPLLDQHSENGFQPVHQPFITTDDVTDGEDEAEEEEDYFFKTRSQQQQPGNNKDLIEQAKVTTNQSNSTNNHLQHQQLISSFNNNSIIDFYASNPFLSVTGSKLAMELGGSGKPNLPITLDSQNSLASNAYKAQQPTAPSSTLLAKLNAVTSRPNAHMLATKLDQKMIDLLEAFYAINDNPEPAAIEMIAKRVNSTVDVIGDWFDKKRLKTNPLAGPRSPPVKKREGGRVVTFSEYQRSLLEAIFDENNYLHPQEYEELSNLIQVPSRNIKIWFKNRRSKQRLSGRITTTPGSANNSD